MLFVEIVFLMQGLASVVDGIQRFGSKKDVNFGVLRGKRLKSNNIASHLVTSPIDCSSLCINESQCLSYNYKHVKTGNEHVCKLKNATAKSHPADLVDDQIWDHYYDKDKEESRSCLDYLRNGASENGLYTITDASGDSYQVYCDLTSEPRSAWTLMLSFAFKNKDKAEFKIQSFEVDSPLNNAQPNLEAYRMGKSQTNLLAAQSTHFRATTSFLKYGVDFVDYVRIRLSQYNVLKTSTPGACQPVEYINIRGNKGVDTTVTVFHTDVMLFHIDTPGTNVCAFDARSGSVLSENNFGFYSPTDSNPKFRGCMNDESTTEMWLGAYL